MCEELSVLLRSKPAIHMASFGSAGSTGILSREGDHTSRGYGPCAIAMVNLVYFNETVLINSCALSSIVHTTQRAPFNQSDGNASTPTAN